MALLVCSVSMPRQDMSEEQKEEMLASLSPEERAEMMEALPPAERAKLLEDMSPEQRDAITAAPRRPRSAPEGALGRLAAA